jgi:hypothetical protein
VIEKLRRRVRSEIGEAISPTLAMNTYMAKILKRAAVKSLKEIGVNVSSVVRTTNGIQGTWTIYGEDSDHNAVRVCITSDGAVRLATLCATAATPASENSDE